MHMYNTAYDGDLRKLGIRWKIGKCRVADMSKRQFAVHLQFEPLEVFVSDIEKSYNVLEDFILKGEEKLNMENLTNFW